MSIELKQLVTLPALLLGIGVSTLGTSLPAHAQFFGWYGYRTFEVPSTIPPDAIYRRLGREGYQPLGPLRRNGRVFLADVADPRGRRMRLIIDAYEGEVLQRFELASRGPAMDAVPYGYDGPPGRISNGAPDLPPPVPVAPQAGAPAPRPTQVRPKVASRTPATAKPRSTQAHVAPPAPPPSTAPGAAEAAQKPDADSGTPTASVPPAPAAKPIPAAKATGAAKKEGPGYANGVPINPLE